MHTLITRTDLVITKADKGEAIVIMDVDDYVAEANRQLSDSKFYKKLTHNPTPVHAERISKAIEQFKEEGLITENNRNIRGLSLMNHKHPSSHFIRKFTKKETPEGQSSVQLIVTHRRYQNM